MLCVWLAGAPPTGTETEPLHPRCHDNGNADDFMEDPVASLHTIHEYRMSLIRYIREASASIPGVSVLMCVKKK